MIETIIVLTTLGALATAQVVETLHHGSIFTDFRAYMEAQGGFLADLFGCPFCLGHSVAAFFTAILLPVSISETGSGWFWLLTFPIVSFAVTRMAQLLNDYTHDRCRTPRVNYDTTFDDLEKEFDALGSRPAEDLTETRIAKP